MRQFLLICLMASFMALCHAGVEVNSASEADLDGIKGIGPALSRKILVARQQGDFKDWPDLMKRVKGLQPKAAQRLSEAGLTVNGAARPPQ
jgi:competence protein ComEA